MKSTIYNLLFLILSSVAIAGNPHKEKTDLKTISGKITDVSGESISGAKFSIIETGETFYADLDGNFNFTLKTDKLYSLSINTVGYYPIQLKSNQLSQFSELSLKSIN